MKIVICGYYGVSNVGDCSILQALKGLVSQYHPKSEITVMGASNLFPFGIKSFFRAIFRPFLWLKPYRLIKSCDRFILGGGGLFTNEEMPWVPVFWALHGAVAYLMGKPVYCLGVSVSPISGLNKLVTKWFLGRCQTVVVRDPASQKLLKSWGISCELGTDLALALDYSPTHKKDSKKFIVLSIRRFKKDDEILYKKLAQCCDSIVEKKGMDIRLIPFQQGDEFDVVVLNKILAQCLHGEHIFVDKYYDNLGELLSVLSQASLVIGMRLHATILSLLVGTPFIALSYMKKVSDFWAEFNDIKTLDLNRFSIDELTNSTSKLLENSDNIKQSLKKTKEELISKITAYRSVLKAF